ncbi:MAG: hypothetical protein KGD63_05290 [Candidatus Lokiarchaeota archaeon]|nr:hypothetical protein [Candidatus Lokiarchaeota archaeon]
MNILYKECGKPLKRILNKPQLKNQMKLIFEIFGKHDRETTDLIFIGMKIVEEVFKGVFDFKHYPKEWKKFLENFGIFKIDDKRE